MAASEDAGRDPRPVYEGEGGWAKATGHQRREHMERVKAWKARNPEAVRDAQSQQGSGVEPQAMSAQPRSATPAPAALDLSHDPNYVALVRIRDDSSAHDSDRIRATDAILRMQAQAEGQVVGESPLSALRSVLDLLQPHERLAWLQGERLEHLSASPGA